MTRRATRFVSMPPLACLLAARDLISTSLRPCLGVSVVGNPRNPSKINRYITKDVGLLLALPTLHGLHIGPFDPPGIRGYASQRGFLVTR